MASASTLRRSRTLFLLVAILALAATGGLAWHRLGQAPSPADAAAAAAVAAAGPAPVAPAEREHLRRPAPRPVAPAAAAAPAPSLLADAGTLASLSTAVIALLGFAITSVMSVRKERRDSALFAIDLEMKRAQLAEIQAKVAQSTRTAAG